MNNRSGIYCIKNLINGLIYIGSTYNFHRRKIQHFNSLRNKTHKNRKLQNAYNKYGEENFNFSILEYCNISELINNEQKWFDLLKPKYNIIQFSDRHEFTESHRINLSVSHLGHKHKEESKIKIGIGLKGNTHRRGKKLSKEHIEAIIKGNLSRQYKTGESHPNYGKSKSSESVEKSRLGRLKKMKEIIKKINKPVIQYDKNGNIINEWKSIKLASETLNINRSHIGEVCNSINNRNTAGGYKWCFKKKINEQL